MRGAHGTGAVGTAPKWLVLLKRTWVGKKGVIQLLKLLTIYLSIIVQFGARQSPCASISIMEMCIGGTATGLWATDWFGLLLGTSYLFSLLRCRIADGINADGITASSYIEVTAHTPRRHVRQQTLRRQTLLTVYIAHR